MLNWLKNNGCPFQGHDILKYVPNYGACEVFDWAIENGAEIRSSMYAEAVDHGKVEILQRLLKMGYPFSPNDCDYMCIAFSSLNGIALEVVKWLVDNGCTLPENSFDLLYDFNFDLIKLLHKKGCPWTENIALIFRVYADVKQIDWAVNNGCEVSVQRNLDNGEA
jgi:hypothetical protein